MQALTVHKNKAAIKTNTTMGFLLNALLVPIMFTGDFVILSVNSIVSSTSLFCIGFFRIREGRGGEGERRRRGGGGGTGSMSTGDFFIP